MFRWGKSSKGPAPASGGGGGGGGAVAAGEVAVQKVEKIDFINIVHIKPPIRGAGSNPRNPPEANGGGDAGGSGTGAIAARKPDIPDINWRADIFIKNTRKQWSLGHKSFRATGR